MKKYCCDRFHYLHEADSRMGLNIRIIKLEEDFINKGIPNLIKNKYSYLITEGYEIMDMETKITMIQYCPFCGKKLSKFYKSDEYINEENHIFKL